MLIYTIHYCLESNYLFRNSYLQDRQSRYKSAKDQWKEQRRDTVKEYMNCVNLTIATLGIENQSTIDENEPIRVMGYDYGSYRQQIVDEKKLHPVITIVLNFTDKIWSGKRAY